MSKIAIIGTGFSSLSCAAYLSKYGHDVEVFEKNDSPGGRCRQYSEDGFIFDMGPSWYWMPEVFEQFYNDFGSTTNEFINLTDYLHRTQFTFHPMTLLLFLII